MQQRELGHWAGLGLRSRAGGQQILAVALDLHLRPYNYNAANRVTVKLMPVIDMSQTVKMTESIANKKNAKVLS